MIPAPKKSASRRKPQGLQPAPAAPMRIPAPIRGWVLNESLSSPAPGGAQLLDNWICGLATIRPRKGYTKFATIASDHVESMWTYKSGVSEVFFAASDDSIFDITSPADPDVPPTASVSGQSTGFWFTEQFGTAGGDFLYAVNGTDSPQLFDGSSWTTITGASSPAITGVTTSNLSFVWSFASRLFFVESGTMSAWYLPVDSIGGLAAEFSLAGIFKKGGALWFGATWSTDSGDGLDDMCAFFSTEGEVAVYSGTNPGSAAAWSKQGVYEIAAPLGPKAVMKAGGDLMVATEIGLVPLSEVVRRDIAALSEGAASRGIESHWQSQVASIPSDWQVVKWPSENIMVVSQPAQSGTGSCLVANLNSGAWSRFTGMDTQSLAVFGGGCYFGTRTGVVYKMQSGGQDDAAPYTAKYLGQAENLTGRGATATVPLARPVFLSNTPITPQIGMLPNYATTLPSAPNASAFSPTDGWDVSVWDTSDWDAAASSGIGADDSQWISIGVTGYAHAPYVQMTFGSTVGPDVEFVGMDATVRIGAMVA